MFFAPYIVFRIPKKRAFAGFAGCYSPMQAKKKEISTHRAPQARRAGIFA